jgi:microcystin-dependent protein
VSTSTSIGNTGGGGSHENRPPYYALAYIMKT